jgi:hypothetical protein
MTSQVDLQELERELELNPTEDLAMKADSLAFGVLAAKSSDDGAKVQAIIVMAASGFVQGLWPCHDGDCSNRALCAEAYIAENNHQMGRVNAAVSAMFREAAPKKCSNWGCCFHQEYAPVVSQQRPEDGPIGYIVPDEFVPVNQR